MKKVFIVILIVLSTIAIPEGMATRNDIYWIIYNKAIYNGNTGRYEYPYYIMQINSWGQVVLTPHPIIPTLRYFFGSFILGPGPRGYLNLWGNVETPGGRWRTLRIPMQVRTLRTGPIIDMNHPVYTPYLSITNRADNNFLLGRRNQSNNSGVANVTAAGLNSFGGLNGKFWPLYQANSSDQEIGGQVSDDGRVLMLQIGKRLYFQALNLEGIPIGKMVLEKTLGYWDMLYAVSISGVLSGGRRLMVFEIFNGMGCGEGGRDIYLQMVGANSGLAVGPRMHFLSEGASPCDGSGVAVDPMGRFLAYFDYSYGYRGFSVEYPLLYKALDSTGHPVGPAHPIAYEVSGWSIRKN